MVRKIKKKKSGIREFVIFLLIVVVFAFVFKFKITPGNQHEFEKEHADKTTPIPSSEIEPDSSISISPDKLDRKSTRRNSRHDPISYDDSYLKNKNIDAVAHAVTPEQPRNLL